VIKTDCMMEHDDIKREVSTPLSLISSTASPFLSASSSFHVTYQPEASENCQYSSKSHPAVRNTDEENSSLNSSSTPCAAGNRRSETLTLSKDLAVPPYAPLMFAEGLLASSTPSQNCSFGSGWSSYGKPSPPPPPLNLFCLPFHPSYSSILPSLISMPPPSEHPGGILMQNLLARYAMSAARLPSLLGGLQFSSNLAAQVPPTHPRPQFTTKLPDVGVKPVPDDGGTERRRVSCDSTATCSGGSDGAVVVTSSESTSSPRVVSSTSDDLDCDYSNQQAPADLSDVTGSSSFSRVVKYCYK